MTRLCIECLKRKKKSMLTPDEKIAMLEADIKRHEKYIIELQQQIQYAKTQKRAAFPLEVTFENHPGQLLT